MGMPCQFATRVGAGAGVGVEVGMGVEVDVGVMVGVAVGAGPNNCPGPQPDTAKLKPRMSTTAIRCLVFMGLTLPYFGSIYWRANIYPSTFFDTFSVRIANLYITDCCKPIGQVILRVKFQFLLDAECCLSDC
jgi:hypothetical protein